MSEANHSNLLVECNDFAIKADLSNVRYPSCNSFSESCQFACRGFVAMSLNLYTVL